MCENTKREQVDGCSFISRVLCRASWTLSNFNLFLMYSPKKKAAKKKAQKEKKVRFGDDFNSLENLAKVIKDKESTAEQLQVALDLIIKYHGTIHSKLGIRAHPDFNLYAEVVLRICRHPNTNKNLILKFDRELRAKNKEYEKEINDFLTKGLNSRGV